MLYTALNDTTWPLGAAELALEGYNDAELGTRSRGQSERRRGLDENKEKIVADYLLLIFN